MAAPQRTLPAAAWVALIFGATLAAYGPVYRAGLIWNDEDYVTTPRLSPLVRYQSASPPRLPDAKPIFPPPRCPRSTMT